MVHFVGAGPGGPDLITLRGAELLGRADCVVYAGSLVNPALLGLVREGVPVYNSAQMTLEQVLEVLEETHRRGGDTVRLHTGDPCLYGAVREQMDALDARDIPWDVTPGVSSFCGAAARRGRSTPFRGSASRSSLPGWRGAPRCLRGRGSPPWPPTVPPW